jgi:hypothetical protein
MEDYQAHLINQMVKDSEVIFKIRQRQPSPKLYVIRNTKNKMKIVKINKRYKLYGRYTHALRWDCCNSYITSPYHVALTQLYGPELFGDHSPWKHVVGKMNTNSWDRPYYIYVKNESMLTMLLLRVKNENNQAR